jgi:hypothetical protein
MKGEKKDGGSLKVSAVELVKSIHILAINLNEEVT